MNSTTITGYIDSDNYFISKLINDDLKTIVSISETCKGWYARVQKCVQQIFGKETSLQDRLIENAVVKYTTLAYYALLEKKSLPCPFPIATFMEHYWKRHQPLLFPINNRQDFLRLADMNQNLQCNSSSMLDFVQKFIKEEHLALDEREVTNITRLFTEFTSTAINSIPMLNRLLNFVKLNPNNLLCVEIISSIIVASKALLRENLLQENISNRIKKSEHEYYLALIESEELQSVDNLLENYASLSPHWLHLQNAVTENDVKRRELILAIERYCRPDQEYLKIFMYKYNANT